MTDTLFAAQNFWDEVTIVDDWLDSDRTGREYADQPLARDWARIAKTAEEVGEAMAEFFLVTGQNPRKGIDSAARGRMLDELADVALTAIIAIQHFTKDAEVTSDIVGRRMTRIWNRMSAT